MSDYGITANRLEEVIVGLAAKGMTALSDMQDLTLAGCRRILQEKLCDAGKPSRGRPAGHYGGAVLRNMTKGDGKYVKGCRGQAQRPRTIKYYSGKPSSRNNLVNVAAETA